MLVFIHIRFNCGDSSQPPDDVCFSFFSPFNFWSPVSCQHPTKPIYLPLIDLAIELSPLSLNLQVVVVGYRRWSVKNVPQGREKLRAVSLKNTLNLPCSGSFWEMYWEYYWQTVYIRIYRLVCPAHAESAKMGTWACWLGLQICHMWPSQHTHVPILVLLEVDSGQHGSAVTQSRTQHHLTVVLS